MRKTVMGVDVDVITEDEAIHSILVAQGEHVPFVGAGLSKEAGVPLAWEICEDIRQGWAPFFEGSQDEWARTKLNWDDLTRRYSSCLENYGSPEDRVSYFRGLLRGIAPSFAHHALALLMSNDKLHRNGITTNFDKLIEQAFVEQNIRECQAIRMPEEAEFWGPESDKCYLECLTTILQGADSSQRLSSEFHIVIAIFDELILARDAVKQITIQWQAAK